MENIKELWFSENEADWKEGLKKYYIRMKNKPKLLEIENEIMKLNEDLLLKMTPKEWYEFLKDTYFEWKINPYWCKSAKEKLKQEYEEENKLEELNEIKNEFLRCNKNDVEQCLGVLSKIKGVKSSVASGLLALLYPKIYGTVDIFVLKSLKEIGEFPELTYASPKDLYLELAIFIIKLLQTTANELNMLFKTDFWTPRKIEMILWTYRKKKEAK